MFTKKKPLMFTTKPTNGVVKSDVENAADAKKPGDAKEDAKDTKKPKGKGANFWAKKAATSIAKK